MGARSVGFSAMVGKTVKSVKEGKWPEATVIEFTDGTRLEIIWAGGAEIYGIDLVSDCACNGHCKDDGRHCACRPGCHPPLQVKIEAERDLTSQEVWQRVRDLTGLVMSDMPRAMRKGDSFTLTVALS